MSQFNVHLNFFLLLAVKLVLDYAGGYYWLNAQNPDTAAISILILNLFVSVGLVNFICNQFKYYFVIVVMCAAILSNILYPVMLVLAFVIVYLKSTQHQTKER
jgi:hypothetical protein